MPPHRPGDFALGAAPRAEATPGRTRPWPAQGLLHRQDEAGRAFDQLAVWLGAEAAPISAANRGLFSSARGQSTARDPIALVLRAAGPNPQPHPGAPEAGLRRTRDQACPMQQGDFAGRGLEHTSPALPAAAPLPSRLSPTLISQADPAQPGLLEQGVRAEQPAQGSIDRHESMQPAGPSFLFDWPLRADRSKRPTG